MSDSVKLNDAGIRELFKSEGVQRHLAACAEKVASDANAKASQVMHTPGVDVYEPGVRVGRNTAVGVVRVRSRKDNFNSLGPAIEKKHNCLKSSVPKTM